MSKFEIRSPSLITAAALALLPALAFADGANHAAATTTTTTTTTPTDNGNGVTVTHPAASGTSKTSASPVHPTDIDPAQVQKVFGMDVALIDLKGLGTDQIKQLQQRLAERGFYRGAIDGKMGPGTRNALSGLMTQQYALNQRLVNQGQITEQFASSIGVETRGRVPVSGIDSPAQRPSAPLPPPNQ